jgi:hypothetical protein
MAEINYNNLYNQLSPLDKLFYDQQFSKNYAPGQENIMLEMKPGYEQMKAAYEAEQKIPKKSFLDKLNPFSSASAAEMPIVPNLSLGYNMPTFNLGTGITNTTAATNMYSPFMDNQEAANQDLVQQIIAENAAKLSPVTSSVMYDEFPQGIMTAAVPQQSFQDFYGSVYEPYDPEKDDYQVRQIQGPEKKGIAKLMEVLGNIPTPLNLLRKAFEGVGPGFIGPKGSRAYGDESLFSTFGRSRTGAEFFQNVRDRKARQEAAARGAAKQADQARIDAFRAIRDSQPSGGSVAVVE